MKLRLLAVGTAAAALLAAMPGAHAIAPQITDSPTDAKGGQKSLDIVSVTFDSIKKISSYRTVKVGKKKKRVPVYTPTDMTVTMTMAGAPDIQPGTSYQVFADETPCGGFIAYSYWRVGTGGPGVRHAMQFGNCGPETPIGDQFPVEGFTVTTVGNSLVWKIPLKSMPPEVTKVKNAVFGGLFAYTAVTDPVGGYSAVDFAPSDVPNSADTVAIDYASSTNVYKLGS